MKALIKYSIGNQIVLSWVVIFILSGIFATMIYLNENNIYIYVSLLLLVPICFVVMICINLYRYRIFTQIYQREYLINNNIEIGEINLQIKKGSYKTKPLKQSYDVTINPLFENATSLYIKSEKYIYIMIKVSDFVIFQHYIQPFLFNIESSKDNAKKKFKEINHYEKELVENDIKLTSSLFPAGLRTIKLPQSTIQRYLT